VVLELNNERDAALEDCLARVDAPDQIEMKFRAGNPSAPFGETGANGLLVALHVEVAFL